MTKEQVIKKIKEILAQDKRFNSDSLVVDFKDENSK